MTDLRRRLATAIGRIPLFDTHEHFVDERTRLAQAGTPHGASGILSYLHYVDCDLVSAGLPAELRPESRASSGEKREAFLRFWPAVAHTGYGRAFRIMASDLWGVDRIDAGTFATLDRNAAAFPKPGYYRTLLRERANIARSCRVVWSGSPTYCDLDYLHPVPQFDHFATVASRAHLRALEAETGRSIHALADLVAALEASFDRRAAEGMIGAKIFLAYKRTIRFEQVAAADAERIFYRATQAHGDTPVGFAEAKPLQDYIVHRIIEQAMERGLPIQIHTGFQNDNANFVENTRPTHLTNAVMAYPRGKFVLLHCGWPYADEAVAMAKTFPNVWPDMAFTYIVGPGSAGRLLGDLIDSVPSNKILGFGGDYNFAEGAYAHARIARETIAGVLATRVEAGDIEEDDAVALARRIMHDNGARLFGFPTLDADGAAPATG